MKNTYEHSKTYGPPIPHDGGRCPFPDEVGLVQFGEHTWSVLLNFSLWASWDHVPPHGITAYRLRADHPYYAVLAYNAGRHPGLSPMVYLPEGNELPEDWDGEDVLWGDGQVRPARGWGVAPFNAVSIVGYRAKAKQIDSVVHWSDCATNSEPAYPAGECDCGGYDLALDIKQPEPVDPVAQLVTYLTALHDWMLTHDHDMSLPDGPLDTNPLDLAESLSGLRLVRALSEEGRRNMVASVAAKSSSGYAQIKLNLSDTVVCYGKARGCVREDGCEGSCLMLAAYEAGIRRGARAGIDAVLGPAKGEEK